MRPADEKNDAPVDRPIQLLGALINHLSVRVPSPAVKRTAQVHGKARELNNNNQLDRLASLVTLQPTPAVDAAGRGGVFVRFRSSLWAVEPPEGRLSCAVWHPNGRPVR